MRLARALELTHNIVSTPNSIEGLDSLLDPSLFEQALAQSMLEAAREHGRPIYFIHCAQHAGAHSLTILGPTRLKAGYVMRLLAAKPTQALAARSQEPGGVASVARESPSRGSFPDLSRRIASYLTRKSGKNDQLRLSQSRAALSPTGS